MVVQWDLTHYAFLFILQSYTVPIDQVRARAPIFSKFGWVVRTSALYILTNCILYDTTFIELFNSHFRILMTLRLADAQLTQVLLLSNAYL